MTKTKTKRFWLTGAMSNDETSFYRNLTSQDLADISFEASEEELIEFCKEQQIKLADSVSFYFEEEATELDDFKEKQLNERED